MRPMRAMTARIVMFRDANKCWRWRITAANNEILGSGEAYSSKTACAKTVKRLARTTGLPVASK